MNERTPNPFVLRHPMSLGDAIAALFREKPKRRLLGVVPPAPPAPFFPCFGDPLNAGPDSFARLDDPRYTPAPDPGGDAGRFLS